MRNTKNISQNNLMSSLAKEKKVDPVFTLTFNPNAYHRSNR